MNVYPFIEAEKRGRTQRQAGVRAAEGLPCPPTMPHRSTGPSRPRAGRRRPDRADQPDPRGVDGHLRCAACARRAARPGPAALPQADRPADAHRRSVRQDAEAVEDDHVADPAAARTAGPGRAGTSPPTPPQVNARWCGDITYIRDLGGLAVPGHRHRHGLPPGRRLGHGRSPAHRPGRRRAGQRDRVAAPRPGPVIFHCDRGCQGGFNWSSQHLDHGGVAMGRPGRACDAGWCAAAVGADRALRPPMRSPAAAAVACCAAGVLAADRVGSDHGRPRRRWACRGRSGSRWFRHAGGMPPLSLDEPTGRYLSFAEREEIALLRAQGVGVREIARRIGRDPGTISRELRRNAATRGGKPVYRARWRSGRRSRPRSARRPRSS